MRVKILGVYLIMVNNTTHSNDFKDDNSDRKELLCKPRAGNLMSALMQMLRCRFDTKHTKRVQQKTQLGLDRAPTGNEKCKQRWFLPCLEEAGWRCSLKSRHPTELRRSRDVVSATINASDVQHVLLRKHSLSAAQATSVTALNRFWHGLHVHHRRPCR